MRVCDLIFFLKFLSFDLVQEYHHLVCIRFDSPFLSRARNQSDGVGDSNNKEER